MAQNSRSERPQIPSEEPREQIDFKQSVQSDGKIRMRRTADIESDEPVTVTTTTSHGTSDIISTIIPALESSAYVLVILGGFLAWSSRKLAVDFMTKHISLVETLKTNLDTQLETAKDQLEILKQVAANNEKLVNTIANIAERNSQQQREPSN